MGGQLKKKKKVDFNKQMEIVPGKYCYTKEMGHMSPFRGEGEANAEVPLEEDVYEQGLQKMFNIGAHWVMANPEKAKNLSRRNGVDSEPLVELTQFIAEHESGASGFMMHIVLSFLARMGYVGWDAYVKDVTEAHRKSISPLAESSAARQKKPTKRKRPKNHHWSHKKRSSKK